MTLAGPMPAAVATLEAGRTDTGHRRCGLARAGADAYLDVATNTEKTGNDTE